MAEDRIDGYIDRVKFKEDTKFALDEIEQITGKIKTFYDDVRKAASAKTDVSGAKSAREATEAAEMGIKANARLRESIKAVEQVVKERFASEAKLVAVQSDYARESAKNRLELQKTNRELKIQAELQQSSEGSIERARARVKALTDERNRLNLFTEEGRVKQAALNEQNNKYNEFIRKNVDALAQQKINVGNYQGSAKIIVDALEAERKKLEELEKTRIRVQNAGAAPVAGFAGRAAGAGGGVQAQAAELARLDQQIEQSRTVIQGFAKVADQPTFLRLAGQAGDATKEVRGFTKTLVELERAGLGNTEGAVALRKQLAELTDQIGDARAEVKALSSDTRSFDLFAGSVTFAADAVQTYVGAMTLFGASEEDAAEATKTLVAVQSVANGVKGLANELTTRGTAANKAYAFVQAQAAVATDATATATKRFTAALALTGIGAIVVAVGLLVSNFDKLKDALTGTTPAQKAYNDTLEDYRKGVQDAVSQTQKVGVAFEQAKTGVLSKDEALKVYNDTLGDSLGKAKSLEEAEALYNSKVDEYIRSMGLRAQANALFAKSAEIAAKGATAALEDQTSLGDKIKAGLAGFSLFSTDYAATAKSLVDSQRRGAEAAKRSAEEQSKSIQDLAANLLTEAIKIEKANDIATPNADKVKKESKKATDARSEALKEQLELEKRNAEANRRIAVESANEIIRQNERIANDDRRTADERIAAFEEIGRQKQSLSAIQLRQEVEEERRVVGEGAKARIESVKKTETELDAASQAFANRRVAIVQETTDQVIALRKEEVDKSFEEGQREIAEQKRLSDQRLQLVQDRVDATEAAEKLAATQDFTARIEQSRGRKRTELERQLQDKLTSISDEAEIKRSMAKVQQLEATKAALGIFGVSSVAIEKQITDELLIQLGIRTRAKNKSNNEDLESQKRLLDEVLLYQQQASEVIGAVFAGQNTKEKNRNQDLLDQIDKRKAAEIEAINASTLTAEEKAARITIAEKKAQIEREQIERRQRKLDQERAQFERALNIMNLLFQIGIAAAKGDVKAFILGSASLVKAIATPVPRFKDGKFTSYEGAAVVGDGGRPEIIEREDGTLERTPARDTLTWLGRNDKVYPSEEAWRASLLSAAHRDVAATGKPVTPDSYGAIMTKKLDQQITLLSKLNNKRELRLGATDKGMTALWRWGANQVSYVNENTKW